MFAKFSFHHCIVGQVTRTCSVFFGGKMDTSRTREPSTGQRNTRRTTEKQNTAEGKTKTDTPQEVDIIKFVLWLGFFPKTSAPGSPFETSGKILERWVKIRFPGGFALIQYTLPTTFPTLKSTFQKASPKRKGKRLPVNFEVFPLAASFRADPCSPLKCHGSI